MIRPTIHVEPDYKAMGCRAASLIDAAVRTEPDIVLALPTGNTPIRTYAELVALHRTTGTDWSRVTTFNLDEYVGVAPDHPESYAAFMERHLFSHLQLPPVRRHIPNGLAPDPSAEVARYEALIDAAGGIDLAVLGVGTNGHLGFNEPGDVLSGPAHVASLTEETWRRNFPDLARRRATGDASNGASSGAGDAATEGTSNADDQFRRAYTMGIATILQARRVLLLASGAAKRDVLLRALNAPVTPRNPASFLQLHRNVTLVLDEAAAP